MIQERIAHIRNGLKDIYILFVLLLSIALIALKWSYLSVPFVGDEMWVYGPAAIKMGNQLPSLLPSSMELSDHFAHPLFFFFSVGLWGNLLGTTVFSLHFFALLVSVVGLNVLYLVIRSFLGRHLAFFSVLIFAVQSIFLGQSSLVLPEVMLTILMFVTIYFYHKEMKWAYMIAGSMLVLTKETGVLLIATLGIWTLIKDLLYEKVNPLSKNQLINYLVVVAPLLFLLIHLLLIKSTYGWYIMPDRMDHFELNLDSYYRRIRNSFHYVFIDQGRRYLIIGLAIAVTLFNSNFKWWQRIGIGLLIFAMMKVFFNYWKLPWFVPLIIVPMLTILLMKKLIWDEFRANSKLQILSIASIFIVIYLLFSSAQFDSLRYLLCTIPFYIVLSLYFVSKFLPVLKFSGTVVFSVVCLFFAVHFTSTNKDFGDDTLNYTDVTQTMQETIAFLEQSDYYESNIEVPFLYLHALSRPECGYLSGSKRFEHLMSYTGASASAKPTLRIFDNMEGQDVYTEYLNDNSQELIFERTRGKYWIKIYKTK